MYKKTGLIIVMIFFIFIQNLGNTFSFDFEEISNSILNEEKDNRINLMEGNESIFNYKNIDRITGSDDGYTTVKNVENEENINYNDFINYRAITTIENIDGTGSLTGSGEIEQIASDDYYVGNNFAGIVEISNLYKNNQKEDYSFFFNNLSLLGYELYLNDFKYKSYDYTYLGGMSLNTYNQVIIEEQSKTETLQKEQSLIKETKKIVETCNGENQY
ncbi:MAG: hypothetical protein Q9M94_05595, partial [Candidatus Gracilibacteria bacterium]|nr:hypothetical protein [Candidatus Gracilibacteria bacterium]